jgi:uncharacterized membrane protein YraQ (UPF0718 family)
LNGTTESFLKAQLNKPPEDSKKWRMATMGLWGVVGIALAGLVMLFVKPSVAVQSTSIIQMTLTAWSGIMVLYLGAQGAVDYKTTSALGDK